MDLLVEKEFEGSERAIESAIRDEDDQNKLGTCMKLTNEIRRLKSQIEHHIKHCRYC